MSPLFAPRRRMDSTNPHSGPAAKARPASSAKEPRIFNAFVAALFLAPILNAQTPTAVTPPPQTSPTETSPIAIIPLNAGSPDAEAKLTGALQVTQGKAIIAASGSITSGAETTVVTLPRRGLLRVCASTTVNLAVDSSASAGELPGLLMAMDHGAIEASFATSRNSDSLLTPDFRVLIAGTGAAEVKVRLGQHGDTCIDNGDHSTLNGSPAPISSVGKKAGANAPYVLVTSIFEGGAYRVEPGQRVMFQHGSLREVVDQEKEPCGCPPSAPKGNEFPLAQSEGLAPLPAATPGEAKTAEANPQPIPPLVYKAAEHAPTPVAAPPQPAPAPASQKKPGLFSKVGHFFRRIFGAE